MFHNNLPTTSIYDEIPKKYADLMYSASPMPLVEGDTVPLYSYQEVPRAFMRQENRRGLLIYHALGAGKTLTAIGIAETMGRQAICLLPARLKSEFIKELKKYGRPEFRPPADWHTLSPEKKAIEGKRLTQEIAKWYTFISYNSQNVARDLRMVGDLNDKVLIIDEVHTLLARIVSPSAKVGGPIYEMIMANPGLRIVALSGTPAISDPFELAVLFNMLCGYLPSEMNTKINEMGSKTNESNEIAKGGAIKKKKTNMTLFPQDYREFNDYFVDRENNRLKNRAVFQDRIASLVSFYPGLWDPEGIIIPRRKPLEMITVHMSEYQWNIYVARRRQELDTERRDKYNTKSFTYAELKKPKRQSSSTYKQGSIQAGLFVPPDYVHIPSKKELHGHTEAEIRKIRAQAMDRINPRDLRLPALEEFSCKFADVMRRLDERKNQITFIFSSLAVMGVDAMSRVLDANGWVRFRRPATRPHKARVQIQDVGLSEAEVMYEEEEESARLQGSDWEGDPGSPEEVTDVGMTYAVINGDTTDDEKADIIDAITSPDNIRGAHIRVLLGTKVIAEGVDLKCVRTVIFLEAQWKRIRTEQVIGRAQRLNSHMNLPLEEREVEVFMYNADAPKGVKVAEALPGDTESVDMQLYRKSNDEGHLIDSYLSAMRDGSLDCRLNLEVILKKFPGTVCRSCLPTGRDLIVPDVRQHILNGTRCETSQNVALRKIMFHNQELRQDKEMNLYHYDTRLKGWVRDPKLTKRYHQEHKIKDSE